MPSEVKKEIELGPSSHFWKLSQQERAALALFLGALVFSLWAAHVGWHFSILDAYGFRQAQTAISVFYLNQGSSWLAYENPVLGPPWSIPFEFPLYQWIVALWVKIFHTPLDEAGRWVSEIFHYLTLFPAASVLESLDVRRSRVWIFLTLFLLSPVYLFWSRTFMIESTALFFSVGFLAFFLRYRRSKRATDLGWGVVFGSLAAVVKITTFYGFAVAAAVIHLKTFLGHRSKKILRENVVPIIAFGLVPFILLIAWTHFADSLKAENPLASGFITSGALNKWNFGTLQQRLSLDFLATLYRYRVGDVGPFGIFWIILITTPFVARKNWKHILATVALFLCVPLTFTNLYIVHSYYSYANEIFLLGALGWCLVGMLDERDWRRFLGIAMVPAVALTMARSYLKDQYRRQSTNAGQHVAPRVLRKLTKASDVVLIYGADWSPAIPYYSERRAIMDRSNRDIRSPAMQSSFSKLSPPYQLGAVLFTGTEAGNKKFQAKQIGDLGYDPVPAFSSPIDVIYLPKRRGGS